MGRRRATKDCPRCGRRGTMEIVLVDGRRNEAPLHKAHHSVWKCAECGAQSPHE